MRILFLSQIIPYPPNAGPRVKTWHVLRYLAARGHEVTLAAFVRPDEAEYVPVLKEVCTAVHTVPIQRSRVRDVGYWLRSHLSGRPWLIERDDLKEMRRLVNRLLTTQSFDVIHADQLTMTQFALNPPLNQAGKRPFTIFDAHNATWSISARMFANAPWVLRPLLSLEAARIKRYEGMLIQEFDHTMVVIPQDKDALLQGVPNGKAAQAAQRISIIPIAVDTVELQPVRRQPDSTNIMTLGSLTYPPNADGIRWFLREVFPLIRAQMPQATLTIIGKNPPADFVQAALEQPDVIKVTGYVPDLTPYMEAAALMVVPVRAGGGMRVRLLEAFARAMPAVTTTIGMEGIAAEPGKHVLVADDVEGFAAETVRLMKDPDLQQRLGENGRLLAESCYDWQVVLRRMDAVYAGAEERINDA
ncbi:MAG: glycosyltransferase [Chloroflexi bacterium]|nr:MAG: glycosyltransferase [Chloroflexota bacterium]